MNIAILVLSIIFGLIVLLLIIALFTEKNYKTQAEMIISAPRSQVFDYLSHIRNQDNFNKWVMVDPNMEKTFSGTDATVGFIYSWNGNKEAGEGEQEIKAIREQEYIDTEIRFKRPFVGLAHARMATVLLPGGETNVIWTTSSSMKYPINLMLPIILKMLEKDMNYSLVKLKGILEN